MRNKAGVFFDGLAFFFLVAEIFLVTWGASGTRVVFMMPMFWTAFAAFSCSLFGRVSAEGVPVWRFPVFWACVGFSIIGLFQCLNISGEYERYQSYSILRSFDYIRALPSSVAAPFGAGNAQSALAELLSAFFTACASFILFQRRSFVRSALAVFSVNAALMGLFAISQLFLNMSNMYFFILSETDFYGSFFLTNAAGAFLNLGVASSFSSAYLCFNRRRTARGLFFCLCAVICVAASCGSGSVGAILSLLVFIGLVVLCAFFEKFGAKAGVLALGLVLVLSSLSMAFLFRYGNISSLGDSLSRFRDENIPSLKYFVSDSISSRIYIYKQTLSFDGMNVFWGRGGNSYRYLVSPKFVERQEKSGTKSFWTPVHPHSDVLSYYFEYGVAGMSLIALCAAWWLFALFSNWKRTSFANYCVAAGVLLCALHSCFDMNLSIPSVMVAFAMMSVVSVVRHKETCYDA